MLRIPGTRDRPTTVAQFALKYPLAKMRPCVMLLPQSNIMWLLSCDVSIRSTPSYSHTQVVENCRRVAFVHIKTCFVGLDVTISDLLIWICHFSICGDFYAKDLMQPSNDPEKACGTIQPFRWLALSRFDFSLPDHRDVSSKQCRY